MEVDVCESALQILLGSHILGCTLCFPLTHTRIVSEPVFTQRSPAPERSRRIPPLRDGACRGWESTSLPLHLLPSGPAVSEGGGQTCGATASPQSRGGGERSPRSCLCRTGGRTVESTRPRHPATASRDPAERWRTRRYKKVQNTEVKKGNWNNFTMQVKSQKLGMRDVRSNSTVIIRKFVLDFQMFRFNKDSYSVLRGK